MPGWIRSAQVECSTVGVVRGDCRSHRQQHLQDGRCNDASTALLAPRQNSSSKLAGQSERQHRTQSLVVADAEGIEASSRVMQSATDGDEDLSSIATLIADPAFEVDQQIDAVKEQATHHIEHAEKETQPIKPLRNEATERGILELSESSSSSMYVLNRSVVVRFGTANDVTLSNRVTIEPPLRLSRHGTDSLRMPPASSIAGVAVPLVEADDAAW